MRYTRHPLRSAVPTERALCGGRREGWCRVYSNANASAIQRSSDRKRKRGMGSNAGHRNGDAELQHGGRVIPEAVLFPAYITIESLNPNI